MSSEHVFPEALGGRHTIRDVCKSCNDHLGQEVDSGLTNNKVADIKRSLLGLSGRSGKVPNPFKGAKLSSDPRIQVNYDPSAEDGERIYVPTRVFKQERDDGTVEVEMVVDPSDEHRIPEMLSRIKDRYDKKALSDGGAYEMSEPNSTRESLERATLSVGGGLDQLAIARGLIKIAYELAYCRLGPVYLKDPIAMAIRHLLALKSRPAVAKAFEGMRLPGTCGIGPSQVLQGIGLRDEDAHYGLIWPIDGGLSCVVQVLGMFNATVVVAGSDYGLSLDDAYLFWTRVSKGGSGEGPLSDQLQYNWI